MMTRIKLSGRRAGAVAALFVALALVGYGSAFACTSVTVSAGASADGSVMTSQTADAGPEDIRVVRIPAADHKPGEMRQVIFNPSLRDPRDPAFEPLVVKGEIPQVAHTYGYIYALYGTQNDHQLSIGETTIWNGERDGLQDPEGWSATRTVSVPPDRSATTAVPTAVPAASTAPASRATPRRRPPSQP